MSNDSQAPNNIAYQREFENLLQRELNRFKRYQRSFGVVLLSIDQFNHLDNTDKTAALSEISSLIKQNSRYLDFASQSSDDRFLIILPESNTDSAFLMAENLRDRIEAHPFTDSVKITCSFGVDMCQQGDEPEDFLARAERALQKAIEGGGNQVETMLEY